MMSENQRFKMVALLKSLKYLCSNILDSHSRIHLKESLLYDNNDIQKALFQE